MTKTELYLKAELEGNVILTIQSITISVNKLKMYNKDIFSASFIKELNMLESQHKGFLEQYIKAYQENDNRTSKKQN